MNKGYLFGVLAALCSALLAIFIKLATEVSSEGLVFFRNLICCIIVIPFLKVNNLKISRSKIFLYSIRTIGGILSLYCFFYASKNIPIVDAILLRNTVPLFTPLIVLLWLKNFASKNVVFAIVVGFIGVMFVIKPSFDFFHQVGFIGLLAGFCAALSLVAVSELSKTESTEKIMFYFFLSTMIISFFPMYLTWKPVESLITWFYVIMVGVVSFLFQYFITKAYTYASVTKVSFMSYLSPVFGGLLSWIIWQSYPDYKTILGVFIVIGSSIYLIREKSKKKAEVAGS